MCSLRYSKNNQSVSPDSKFISTLLLYKVYIQLGETGMASNNKQMPYLYECDIFCKITYLIGMDFQFIPSDF